MAQVLGLLPDYGEFEKKQQCAFDHKRSAAFGKHIHASQLLYHWIINDLS